MEPEGSLPQSQETATCPYPEPARSSSHPHINPLYASPLPHTRYTPRPSRCNYRVRINYRRILQNHIFTNTEQKYMMLLPYERGMSAVS